MDSFSSIQTKTFQEETLSIRCQLQTSKLAITDSHQHSSFAKWKYMCQMHGIETNEEQHSYPIQLGLFHPFHGLEVQRHESHSNPQEEEEEEEVTVEFVDSSSNRSRLTFIPFVAPWSRPSSRSSSVYQSSHNDDDDDDESQTPSLSLLLTVSNQRQSTVPQLQHLYANHNLDHPSHHHNMHKQHHNNTSMLPMRLLTRPQSPFPHQRIRSSEVSRTMFSCTKERRNHDDDMDNSVITTDSVSLSSSHHSGIKAEQDTITIFLHQITKVQCVDALNIVLHTPTEEYVITTESTNGRDLLHVFLKRFLPNSTACFNETAALEERHEILSHNTNTLRSQVSRTESMDMQKFQDYAMNKTIEHDTHVDKIWRWSKRVICDMTNICSCGEEEGTHENAELSNDLNTATKDDHDDCQTEISEALELDLDDYQHL